MKKLMENLKKIALVILLFYATDAFAQTQKIHTLQVTDGTATETMTTDALIQLDSKKKGLLLPRVALTDAKLSAPLATHTAGMTVYNTATVSSTATVEGVTPGYYYNNGTKWVRLTDTDDQEWVYDSTSKQINLKRSGTAPFINKVYFDGKGNYRNYQTEESAYWDYGSNQWLNSYIRDDVSTFLLQRESKNLTGRESVSNNITYFSKNIDNKSLLVNEEDAGKAHILTTSSSSIQTVKDNAIDYSHLTGSYSGASHQGAGNVKYLIGSSSGARISKGTNTGKNTPYIMSSRATAQSHTPGEVQQVVSYGAYTIAGNTAGQINKLNVLSGGISYFGKNKSTVAQSYALDISQGLYSGAAPTISNAVGLYYRGFYDVAGITTNPTITNNYGILLEDIDRGQNNYAIYTNKGLSSFGDDVQIRNINTQVSTDPKHKIVVADATGKLRVSDASINSNPASNAWTLTGNGGTNSATNFIGTTDNQALNIRTNNTNRVTILENGNVGIGTTEPLVDLTVRGKDGKNAEVIIERYNDDGNGANLTLMKSNGTAASPQGVKVNQSLGRFRTGGYSGYNISNIQTPDGFDGFASMIETRVAAPPTTDGYIPTNMTFNLTKNSGARRNVMTMIGDSGNVGIGTTEPKAKLTVVDEADVQSVNKIGLYVGDVKNSTASNYAIYTNKGRVRLGDYMIAGKNIHNTPILDSESNILDQTILVNNNEERSYSYVAGFYRLAPTNEVTEAPYINFAHQAPNESVARRGGYIKSGLVFNNSTTPTGGYMEIQSCFGPASHTDWTLTDASKTKILINPQGGNVGIGTKDPKAKLDVNGNVKIVDGTQGAGKVLTSDAAGNAHWETPNVKVSLVQTNLGEGVTINKDNKNQWLNTGTTITLPPGKWLVTANLVFTVEAAEGTLLDGGVWLRSTFCDSATATDYSVDIISNSKLISGGLAWKTIYGTMLGSMVIHNKTTTNKTYYLKTLKNIGSKPGILLPDNVTVHKFGGENNRENIIKGERLSD